MVVFFFHFFANAATILNRQFLIFLCFLLVFIIFYCFFLNYIFFCAKKWRPSSEAVYFTCWKNYNCSLNIEHYELLKSQIKPHKNSNNEKSQRKTECKEINAIENLLRKKNQNEKTIRPYSNKESEVFSKHGGKGEDSSVGSSQSPLVRIFLLVLLRKV